MTNIPLKKFLKTHLQDILTDKELEVLPKTIKIIGHVALLKIEPILEPHIVSISKLIQEWNNKIRTVAIQKEKSQYITRNVKYEIVYGEESTKTVHIENGIKYVLDPTEITFSLGNQRERLRLYNMNLPNKIVIDMFACVGQFSFPVAIGAKPKEVISIEINPKAFDYLIEGIKLNKIKNITPILGDSRKVIPSNKADLIIMGYLHSTHRYIQAALKGLKEQGGRIIMHISVHNNEQLNEITDYINKQLKIKNYEMIKLNYRFIKNYSPYVKHMAIDFSIKKSGE